MNDDYQAYLLRLQRTDDTNWRIMLRNTQNGMTQYFVSQCDLLLFIHALFERVQDATIANNQASSDIN